MLIDSRSELSKVFRIVRFINGGLLEDRNFRLVNLLLSLLSLDVVRKMTRLNFIQVILNGKEIYSANNFVHFTFKVISF